MGNSSVTGKYFSGSCSHNLPDVQNIQLLKYPDEIRRLWCSKVKSFKEPYSFKDHSITVGPEE